MSGAAIRRSVPLAGAGPRSRCHWRPRPSDATTIVRRPQLPRWPCIWGVPHRPIGVRRWGRPPIDADTHRPLHARSAALNAQRPDKGGHNDPRRRDHRDAPFGEFAPAVPVVCRRRRRGRPDGDPAAIRGSLGRCGGGRRHPSGCWGWRWRWEGCGIRRSGGGYGGRRGGATIGCRGRGDGRTAEPLCAVPVPPESRRGEEMDTGGPHAEGGSSKERDEGRQEKSLFSKLRKHVGVLS